MDGNAEAEPCTRELAWFHSATCMDGLAQVHGWTFRSAWLRFRRCMDGLSKRDLGAEKTHPRPTALALLNHLGKKRFAFSSLDKSNLPYILTKI